VSLPKSVSTPVALSKEPLMAGVAPLSKVSTSWLLWYPTLIETVAPVRLALSTSLTVMVALIWVAGSPEL
jgi:hypothetical protein